MRRGGRRHWAIRWQCTVHASKYLLTASMTALDGTQYLWPGRWHLERYSHGLRDTAVLAVLSGAPRQYREELRGLVEWPGRAVRITYTSGVVRIEPESGSSGCHVELLADGKWRPVIHVEGRAFNTRCYFQRAGLDLHIDVGLPYGVLCSTRALLSPRVMQLSMHFVPTSASSSVSPMSPKKTPMPMFTSPSRNAASPTSAATHASTRSPKVPEVVDPLASTLKRIYSRVETTAKEQLATEEVYALVATLRTHTRAVNRVLRYQSVAARLIATAMLTTSAATGRLQQPSSQSSILPALTLKAHRNDAAAAPTAAVAASAIVEIKQPRHQASVSSATTTADMAPVPAGASKNPALTGTPAASKSLVRPSLLPSEVATNKSPALSSAAASAVIIQQSTRNAGSSSSAAVAPTKRDAAAAARPPGVVAAPSVRAMPSSTSVAAPSARVAAGPAPASTSVAAPTTSASVSAAPASTSTSVAVAPVRRRANWSGRWVIDRSRSDSLEPFLKLMGLGYLLRKVMVGVEIVSTWTHTPGGASSVPGGYTSASPAVEGDDPPDTIRVDDKSNYHSGTATYVMNGVERRVPDPTDASKITLLTGKFEFDDDVRGIPPDERDGAPALGALTFRIVMPGGAMVSTDKRVLLEGGRVMKQIVHHVKADGQSVTCRFYNVNTEWTQAMAQKQPPSWAEVRAAVMAAAAPPATAPPASDDVDVRVAATTELAHNPATSYSEASVDDAADGTGRRVVEVEDDDAAGPSPSLGEDAEESNHHSRSNGTVSSSNDSGDASCMPVDAGSESTSATATPTTISSVHATALLPVSPSTSQSSASVSSERPATAEKSSAETRNQVEVVANAATGAADRAEGGEGSHSRRFNDHTSAGNASVVDDDHRTSTSVVAGGVADDDEEGLYLMGGATTPRRQHVASTVSPSVQGERDGARGQSQVEVGVTSQGRRSVPRPPPPAQLQLGSSPLPPSPVSTADYTSRHELQLRSSLSGAASQHSRRRSHLSTGDSSAAAALLHASRDGARSDESLSIIQSHHRKSSSYDAASGSSGVIEGGAARAPNFNISSSIDAGAPSFVLGDDHPSSSEISSSTTNLSHLLLFTSGGASPSSLAHSSSSSNMTAAAMFNPSPPAHSLPENFNLETNNNLFPLHNHYSGSRVDPFFVSLVGNWKVDPARSDDLEPLFRTLGVNWLSRIGGSNSSGYASSRLTIDHSPSVFSVGEGGNSGSGSLAAGSAAIELPLTGDWSLVSISALGQSASSGLPTRAIALEGKGNTGSRWLGQDTGFFPLALLRRALRVCERRRGRGGGASFNLGSRSSISAGGGGRRASKISAPSAYTGGDTDESDSNDDSSDDEDVDRGDGDYDDAQTTTGRMHASRHYSNESSSLAIRLDSSSSTLARQTSAAVFQSSAVSATSASPAARQQSTSAASSASSAAAAVAAAEAAAARAWRPVDASEFSRGVVVLETCLLGASFDRAEKAALAALAKSMPLAASSSAKTQQQQQQHQRASPGGSRPPTSTSTSTQRPPPGGATTSASASDAARKAKRHSRAGLSVATSAARESGAAAAVAAAENSSAAAVTSSDGPSGRSVPLNSSTATTASVASSGTATVVNRGAAPPAGGSAANAAVASNISRRTALPHASGAGAAADTIWAAASSTSSNGDGDIFDTNAASRRVAAAVADSLALAEEGRANARRKAMGLNRGSGKPAGGGATNLAADALDGEEEDEGDGYSSSSTTAAPLLPKRPTSRGNNNVEPKLRLEAAQHSQHAAQQQQLQRLLAGRVAPPSQGQSTLHWTREAVPKLYVTFRMSRFDTLEQEFRYVDSAGRDITTARRVLVRRDSDPRRSELAEVVEVARVQYACVLVAARRMEAASIRFMLRRDRQLRRAAHVAAADAAAANAHLLPERQLQLGGVATGPITPHHDDGQLQLRGAAVPLSSYSNGAPAAVPTEGVDDGDVYTDAQSQFPLAAAGGAADHSRGAVNVDNDATAATASISNSRGATASSFSHNSPAAVAVDAASGVHLSAPIERSLGAASALQTTPPGALFASPSNPTATSSSSLSSIVSNAGRTPVQVELVQPPSQRKLSIIDTLDVDDDDADDGSIIMADRPRGGGLRTAKQMQQQQQKLEQQQQSVAAAPQPSTSTSRVPAAGEEAGDTDSVDSADFTQHDEDEAGLPGMSSASVAGGESALGQEEGDCVIV